MFTIKYIETTNINVNFIENQDKRNEISCILQVDLKHPKQLRWSQSDLRSLPENMVI